MSKTLTGTGHPHYFYPCFKILSFYQDSEYFSPTTQLFILYVCISDSGSGSARYCWGGCLLCGRSWVHGALGTQLSQLSCFSWWQCLSLEWYPTPSQPGRKGGAADGKTILSVCFMTPHNLPSRILCLKRCFWIQSSLFAIPVDWIFNDLKGWLVLAETCGLTNVHS